MILNYFICFLFIIINIILLVYLTFRYMFCSFHQNKLNKNIKFTAIITHIIAVIDINIRP